MPYTAETFFELPSIAIRIPVCQQNLTPKQIHNNSSAVILFNLQNQPYILIFKVLQKQDLGIVFYYLQKKDNFEFANESN